MINKDELIEVMAKAAYEKEWEYSWKDEKNDNFRETYLENAQATLKALCKALPSAEDAEDAKYYNSVLYNQLKELGNEDN